MENEYVVKLQTALIGGQVLVAAVQAWIYYRQARLMRETANLTAALSRDQKAFQSALSRPAITIMADWHAPGAGQAEPYFDIVATNCGNGPAEVRSFKFMVRGQEYPTIEPADYAGLARALGAGEFIRDCGGLTSSGDHWIAAGAKETLFHVSLADSVPQELFPSMVQRLNVQMIYGSVFPDETARIARLRLPLSPEQPV